jgi:DNA-binding transcriptional MerR regulator
MEQEAAELSIETLAERVGVPLRTIRFYIARGLLPGPGGRGKAAAYGDEHLLRLQLIRRLAERRVPLEEIRYRLAGLSLEDVRALLAEEVRRDTELQRVESASSPKEYVSALLRRAQAARQDGAETPRRASPAGPPPAPQEGETWQRWELAPGIELQVRSDVARRNEQLIRRLRAVADSAK